MLPLIRILCFTLLGIAALSAQAGCPRIVSQSPYLSIALDWLGRGECIVGVSRYDKKDLPRTGGVADPDAAAIAALHPDLLVTSTLTKADVLQQVTPAGARALRVGGSRSLAETERMLSDLAEASEAPDGPARVRQFSRELRQRLADFPGHGRRVLLLSACAEKPYSYSRNTVLGDLAEQAGLTLADPADGIHHLGDGPGNDGIPALVASSHPDLVINFIAASASQCNAALGALPVPLVMLSGDNFFYPGPRLLEGLDELKEALKP